jgi:hypothetical protein
MRVSNLIFDAKMKNNAWLGHRVEMPNTDMQRHISSTDAVRKFIAEFGDVEIVYDEYYGHYAVPAFTEGREAYSKLKQADCDRYGSN